jgi:hypothetical protein
LASHPSTLALFAGDLSTSNPTGHITAIASLYRTTLKIAALTESFYEQTSVAVVAWHGSDLQYPEMK